jgi:predicted nucleotidyltransferase
VLARTSTGLTMRSVADLAGVSPQQGSVVIGRLVELGVVERRDVPPASLVSLATENVAAQAVLLIANVRQAVLDRLTVLASGVVPAPASLVVFGSFARGEAGPDSDVDVLAVRPSGQARGVDEWTDSLGRWVDQASRAIGNPVNLIEAAAEEMPILLKRKGPTVWRDAAEEGVVLVGSPLADLGRVA